MTHKPVIIINRVDSMHARAPRARVKISTRTFGQPMVLAEKIKVKVYVNEGKSLSTYKDTTRL